MKIILNGRINHLNFKNGKVICSIWTIYVHIALALYLNSIRNIDFNFCLKIEILIFTIVKLILCHFLIRPLLKLESKVRL
jgi:hypothetical protein